MQRGFREGFPMLDDVRMSIRIVQPLDAGRGGNSEEEHVVSGKLALLQNSI